MAPRSASTEHIAFVLLDVANLYANSRNLENDLVHVFKQFFARKRGPAIPIGENGD